jgi:ABC-type amino acid transport substrate-binding protein
MFSKTLDGYGMFAELVTTIWKEAGYEVKFDFVSPHYSNLLAKWGKDLAKAPAIENQASKKSFYFSNAIFTLPLDFFYKRENFPNGVNKDLYEYKIGAISKFYYEDLLKDHNLNITYYENEKELYLALINDNIDMLIASRNLFIEIMLKYTKHIYRYAIYEEKFFSDSNFCLAFSKNYYNSDYLLSLFNQSFEKVKKNGEVNKILRKYELID